MKMGFRTKMDNVRQGYRPPNHSTRSAIAMKPKIKEDKNVRINALKKSFEEP